MAAPLIAGIAAAAQQGRARPFGFLDPLLYQLAGTTALRAFPYPAGCIAATGPQRRLRRA
jgi:subtilase family serine protease